MQYLCAAAGKWLLRIVFLETVAGVPGMVAGMLRHMRSLRRMERDRGWIHTLLEEARPCKRCLRMPEHCIAPRGGARHALFLRQIGAVNAQWTYDVCALCLCRALAHVPICI